MYISKKYNIYYRFDRTDNKTLSFVRVQFYITLHVYYKSIVCCPIPKIRKGKGATMQIENLSVGMIIKNYKELCELLCVEPKASTNANGRKSHHKEFERYFEYDKQGNKYIITKIYNKTRDKIENRGGNNNVFTEDFQRLMVYMLHNNKDKNGSIVLSKGALYKATNLVNDNYSLCRTNIPKLSEVISIPQDAIYEFYDYNSKKLSETVERNLKAMRRQAILMFENVVSVAIYDSIIATNELNKPIVDSKGKLVYGTKLVHREATKEEKQVILRYEDEVLSELGLNTTRDVFIRGKWNEFKREVDNRLKYYNTNMQYYYDSYKITWNDYKIDNLYNELCSDIDTDIDIKNSLNSKMVKSINDSTTRRNTKAIANKDMPIILDKDKYKVKQYKYQSKSEYVEQQQQVTFNLINNKAPSLKGVIEKCDNITDKQITLLDTIDINTQINLDTWNSAIPF